MEIREIVLPPGAEKDEALRFAADALIAAAARRGLEIALASAPGDAHCLLVGGPDRNPHAARALGAAAGRLPLIAHPHGFAVRRAPASGLLLHAPSPLGEAYGLLWLADRIAVTGEPPLRARREPAFSRRFMHINFPTADLSFTDGRKCVADSLNMRAGVEAEKEQMRRALAWGASDILLHHAHLVMPWDDQVEGPRSDEYAHWYAELVDYAHALHLRAFAYGDEFLYSEQALRRAGATLSPDDPSLWRALQGKYRGLLRRLPGLDGVGVRIGEVLPWGRLRAFDVIHNDSPLRLEEKYRRFVTAVHEVVAGEFGKEYLHRTWVCNDWEQHSVPDIFERIFAPLPTENLIVSIKLTKTDQWYYQALNPTFGLTPHTTAVELELVHSYHGCQAMPDYAGEWLAAGLRYARARGATAASMGLPNTRWMEASTYAAARLLWDPSQEADAIARDWAARNFGRDAAPGIARMLALSDDAMLKGLYVKPYASTHAWNPLAHLLTRLFVVAGDPLWDEARGHLAFLREIYWQCRPWLDDTLRELDRGTRLWARMLRQFAAAEPHITEPGLAADARRSLELGEALIALNRAYIGAAFAYFAYEERPRARQRRAAERALGALDERAARYRGLGGDFNLIGIEQFQQAARRGLVSAGEAARLAVPPATGETERRVQRRMCEETEALGAAPDAVKVLSWEGNVDGRELVTVFPDDRVEAEHVAADPMSGMSYRFYAPAPAGWRVVVKPIEARGWAYVVEQPGAANGGRIVFCVDDPQDGRAVYRLELYAVPAKVDEDAVLPGASSLRPVVHDTGKLSRGMKDADCA